MISFSTIVVVVATTFAGVVHCDTALNQSCPPNTQYPSHCQITTIFNNLRQGNFDAFLKHVAADAHW
jgi:hypothetical protein